MLTKEQLKVVNAAYDALAPIANRSAMIDTRNMAKILMRVIEDFRGDEKKTELPSFHHT
jgi:hypothetical protein